MIKQAKNKHSWVLVGILAGSITAVLNGSILNVAVPLFMDVFQANVTTTQWIVSGYILATGLISPSVGYLGDRFGYKPMFLGALMAILFTSLLCALAQNIAMLIVCRALQGVAGGIIMPITLAMIYQLIPKEEQAMAVSYWNVSNIGGNVLGPVLAGWLLNYLSWQWLFFVGWPLIIPALILGIKYIPHKMPANQKARPDFMAMSMVSAFSVMVLVALSNSSTWGWQNPITAGCVIVGLMGIACFVVHCLRSAQPLLNFKVFKHRGFSLYVILDFICYNNTYAFLFVVPLFFQNALGFSIFETSLVTLPTAIMMTLVIPFVGKMYNKQGPKKLIGCGTIILLVASSPLLFLSEQMSPWVIITSFMCRSVGLSFISTAAINMGMGSLPKELAGHGSAMASWLKQVMGSAVISVSSAFMLYRINVYQSSESILSSSQLYLLGTRDIFIYMVVIILVAFPVLWLIPKHQAKSSAKEVSQ